MLNTDEVIAMINDVSICINNIESHPNTVIAACRFAERHQARLTAIYIKLDTVEIARWSDSALMNDTADLISDQQVREDNALKKFKSVTNGFRCEKAWRTVNQSSNPVTQMLCTDIIFADQPTNDRLSYYGDDSFINHLILQTKRPVIMIPSDWNDDEFATRILLGWNKSPEAMRAASDAVPIMQQCQDVKILDVVKNTLFHAEPEEAPDIEAYLLSKGIKSNLVVTGVHRHKQEESILVDYANTNAINLIVVGAYGHSRLREVVMGGVTKHLVAHSPVPVLFSH